MSTTEVISDILDSGCQFVTIGRPPENAGPPGSVPKFFVHAKQGIPTGSHGNAVNAEIQAVGETIAECLNKLTAQVDAIAKLKTGMTIPLLRENGR